MPAGISCYLGVTEPAIFGVNLKYGFPFICGMIGSACAAVLCVATNTTANAIGVGGLPGILSIQTKYMGSFAICMAVAVAVPFILTVIVGKKKLISKEKEPENEKSADNGTTVELKAFLKGKVIPLKDVNDGVFSEGIMGEGVAIIPENEILYAPADGKVTVVMPDSCHACGLLMENGAELLLHIGIDTVDMQGDGFEYLIKEGDTVKAGDPLIRFSREKIKKAGHPDVTVCIITDCGEDKKIKFYTDIEAEEKTTVIGSIGE